MASPARSPSSPCLSQANGHDVTIQVPGDASSPKLLKPPFTYWGELASAGVKAVFGPPSDAATLSAGGKYHVVVENCGKKLAEVKPAVDWALASGAEQFFFVSSAGMYSQGDLLPHLEGDPVKASADQAAVERHLAASGLNYAVFRPQYVTGHGSNKDCEEWFFDRIARGRRIPIPGCGMQLTNVTHAEDLGAMIAAAVGAETARCATFNCVGDRAVTLDGMARLCAAAAGKPPPEIVHYDPKAVPSGVDAGAAFPFRPVHFYAEPRAAKALLGWAPKHRLPEVMAERYKHYVALGRDKKDLKFDVDELILGAAAPAVAVHA